MHWKPLESSPFAELSQVIDHNRDCYDQEDDSNRRARPVVAELKELFILLIGNHVCTVLTSTRHYVNDIEHLKRGDNACGGYGNNRAHDGRDNNPEENLEFVRTVNTRRLQDITRHTFEGRREEYHGEA